MSVFGSSHRSAGLPKLTGPLPRRPQPLDLLLVGGRCARCSSTLLHPGPEQTPSSDQPCKGQPIADQPCCRGENPHMAVPIKQYSLYCLLLSATCAVQLSCIKALYKAACCAVLRWRRKCEACGKHGAAVA